MDPSTITEIAAQLRKMADTISPPDVGVWATVEFLRSHPDRDEIVRVAAEQFGVESDVELDAEKVEEFLRDNGIRDFLDSFEDEVLDWAVEYHEDEVFEALRDSGRVPDFDLDDLKYNVREAQRMLDELASTVGA